MNMVPNALLTRNGGLSGVLCHAFLAVFWSGVYSTQEATVNSVFARNCSVVESGIVGAIGGEKIQKCFDVRTVRAIGSKSAVPCAVIVGFGTLIDSCLDDRGGRGVNKEGKESQEQKEKI